MVVVLRGYWGAKWRSRWKLNQHRLGTHPCGNATDNQRKYEMEHKNLGQREIEMNKKVKFNLL